MTYREGRTSGPRGEAGAGSTAPVLWLMILLVFLPIATIHVAARLLPGDPVPGPAVHSAPLGSAKAG